MQGQRDDLQETAVRQSILQPLLAVLARRCNPRAPPRGAAGPAREGRRPPLAVDSRRGVVPALAGGQAGHSLPADEDPQIS
jgi:hypothetical protein